MGLYFAWLGFYNQMLVVPAVLGVLVFLYGACTNSMDSVNQAGFVFSSPSLLDPPILIVRRSVPERQASCGCALSVRNTASSGQSMFPSSAPHVPSISLSRQLSESCPLYRLSWIFDNDLTPFFAFCVALWGLSILHTHTSLLLQSLSHLQIGHIYLTHSYPTAALYMELWKRRQAILIWR